MMKLKNKPQRLQIIRRVSKTILVLVLFYLVPIHAHGANKCESKLKYKTLAIHTMVYQCFQHLNANSIQMFGAPMIPMLGFSQCSCITDKIRTNYECTEDYMKTVETGTAGEILGEYSKECIIEGAMGDGARDAYLNAVTDDKGRLVPKDNATKKDTPSVKPKTKGKQLDWKDLSSQG